MSPCSSVLPGQSPPTALICTPAPTMLSERIVALRLSAVTVVIMSAPATASSAVAATTMSKSMSERLLQNFSAASGSMSKTCSRLTPSRARKASAWNSDCAPRPMIAIERASVRARYFAASAEVAAVRRPVMIVISETRQG
ncbi:hypothetical protein D9M68_815720 [compost metagenome]